VETPAQQVSADLGSFNVYGDKVPQSVNSTSDPSCTLREWLVFPPRGSTEFYTNAAFSSLRARAAENSNAQVGLSTGIRRATHERLVWVKPPLALPFQKPSFLAGGVSGVGIHF